MRADWKVPVYCWVTHLSSGTAACIVEFSPLLFDLFRLAALRIMN